MNHTLELRILFTLFPLGIFLTSCAAPESLTHIQSNATEEVLTSTTRWNTPSFPEELPTQTPLLPTATSMIDEMAPNNQMLAYFYVPGEDPEPMERLAELYTIHADGSHRTRLFSEQETMMRGLVSSPDGKRIAFWSCPGDMLTNCYSNVNSVISIVDWDGGEVRLLTDSPGNNRDPDWSPDGRIVYISDQTGSNQIYIMNSDGSEHRMLTNQPIQNSNPKWSPDGKWIAYSNLMMGKQSIFIISPEGEPAGEPIPGDAPDWSPATYPGGSQLAFDCFQAKGDLDICTVKPDGSGLTNLTNTPFDEHCPAWSPDGNWIAFQMNTGTTSYVGKVCTTCTEDVDVIRLTDESTPAGCPIWSPGGSLLAILSVQGLFLVNADGKNATQLVEGIYFNPIWRP